MRCYEWFRSLRMFWKYDNEINTSESSLIILTALSLSFENICIISAQTGPVVVVDQLFVFSFL